MSKLLGMKLHFKKLYTDDNPFVERFGTSEQKEDWVKGGQEMVNCQDENALVLITNRLGKIRDEVHSGNEDSTEYRLLFLQKGPQTIEEIRRALGSEISEAVQKLRNL